MALRQEGTAERLSGHELLPTRACGQVCSGPSLDCAVVLLHSTIGTKVFPAGKAEGVESLHIPLELMRLSTPLFLFHV